MKKILLTIMLITTIFLTGCGKLNDKEIKDKFINDVNNLKSYNLKGTLKLINNEDTYEYNVETSYKKGDYYKVSLINKSNKYEQKILRNDDGVYVITPSLNKSFKFQSDWPYNNSQVYILKSLANDLQNDESYKFEQKDDNYILNISANYPNNPNLVKQNIILDKNYDLKKVEVLDKNGIVNIEFIVEKLDKKPTYNEEYFEVEEQIVEDKDQIDKETEKPKEKETEDSKEKETMSIDEALFPLYLPTNTSMSNKEVIDTEIGERVIMTFSGDKPFILVEENVTKEDELTIVPTYGQPFMLIDTVGSLTDVSYTWTSNGIEYYIVSDVMNQNELLEVASSIGIVSTLSEK